MAVPYRRISLYKIRMRGRKTVMNGRKGAVKKAAKLVIPMKGYPL